VKAVADNDFFQQRANLSPTLTLVLKLSMLSGGLFNFEAMKKESMINRHKNSRK
jgi:hypothetical protein